MNLSTYTTDGKLVNTFVDGMIEEGLHSFTPGEGLQPGIYLIILTSATTLKSIAPED